MLKIFRGAESQNIFSMKIYIIQINLLNEFFLMQGNVAVQAL